ncbi:TonB-dependent receptor domain-containing protein [Chitinophaga sp. RAB17]|uniref:TonB-dependent receptor domain-containing protein n=1 Tax=Chitinophaga sp. RAB17 TaxID=3233049 RepID=UPI003F8ED48E
MSIFKIFRIIFLPILLLIVNNTYGQTDLKTIIIRGILIDSSTRAPIELATVVVTKTDNRAVQSVLTGTNGSFLLKVPESTDLMLHISYMGYHAWSSKISPAAGPVNLGLIGLVAKTGVLNEIIVNGKKPLIQSRGDKLIYNAALDISNKSGSAADVLRKAPMITIGADGEVKLRGNGNIKVLLNGVPSGILARNLKEALKMIPASSIESVEVITSPSAKYEAEGAAGVINITTKKKMKGTGGSIDLSAGNLEQSVNGNLNMNRGKFSINLNLEGSLEKSRTVSELNRVGLADGVPIGSLFQRNDETQKDRGGFGELAIEYRLDSSQKMGVSISHWKAKWPAASDGYNSYRDKQGVSEYNQISRQNTKINFTEFSLNYQKKFKHPGQELQLISQYSLSCEYSNYLTDQSSLAGKTYFREQSPNTGHSRDFSFQADYVQPLDHAGRNLLEMGGRYSKNSSSSSFIVFNNRHTPGSEQLEEDPTRANAMSYYQDIAAAYLNLSIKTTKNWAFRLGTRYENTRQGGDFRSTQPSFRSEFNNVVTSIMINKKINEVHDWKLSFTERIRRPFIWDLNPYVNASDPRNLSAGNPELKPEVNRMFELAHNYNAPSGFSVNSSIYFQTNSNAIESLRTVDSLGVSRTAPQNIAANKRLGANIYSSLQINNDWTLSGDAEFYHVWYKSKVLNMGNEANLYAVSINSSYELPKDFTIQFSGDYSNGYVTLQGSTSANYTYHFSALKECYNKKVSIALSVNNPFQHTFIQRSTAIAPSFSSNTASWYYNRSFSISIGWKFGKVRSDNEEEKKEMNVSEKPMRRDRAK